MSNEQIEHKMEFIVATLAQVAVNDQKHETRLSGLERIAKLMVRAGLRERRTRSDADDALPKHLPTSHNLKPSWRNLKRKLKRQSNIPVVALTH